MDDTFISQKTDPSTQIEHPTKGRLISAKRRRVWREYLTAYLMVGPAMILIFVFGIFPVAFALYVSLHKWRLVRSDFRGITNYVSALDNLFYTLLFLMAVGCLYAAYMLVRRTLKQAAENKERPWLFIIPSLLYTTTVIAFVRWVFFQLPEFLDIADKIRGLEKTSRTIYDPSR